MHWLLQDILHEDSLVILLITIVAFVFAVYALNVVCYLYLFRFPWFCFYAFLALVAFIAFSSCCNSLRTIIVSKSLSLGPFSVSPLPPSPEFAFVAPRRVEVSRLRRVLCETPVMDKKREEEKRPIPYFKCPTRYQHWLHYFPHGDKYEFEPTGILGAGIKVYSLEDLRRGHLFSRWRDIDSESRSNRSPTVIPDAVDLLCEQFAAMHLRASAQASAYVHHQDEPSFSMPVDATINAVVVQSWKDEADADSLALEGNTFPSSSAGTPFPVCNVEMEDSSLDDSYEIPSVTAGEIGPVAMDIGGDFLSMDNHVQEPEQQQEQESPVDFITTVAMQTAAALAFMPPEQEQSMPEEHTLVCGTDNYLNFGPGVIADCNSA